LPSLVSLKPSESLSEIIAGLIIVLSFTLAASVLSGGGENGARAALVGAIGANVAWGIIDAVLYLLNSTFDRNRLARLVRAIHFAPNEAAALAAIKDELDPYLASVTRVEDREQLYQNVYSSLVRGQLRRQRGLLRDELMGAIAVFCIALVASLPAVLPLALVDHPWIALRLSNLLVVGLLFTVGYHWAKYVDANRWLAGFALVALGLALVAVAVLLGG
jgi:hypothetical protein